MTQSSNSVQPPTDETIQQLDTAVRRQDHRAYTILMKQTDWAAASAEQLDKAIGCALALGDSKQSKILAQHGLDRFPDYEVFDRVWRMLNPRPARTKPVTRETPPTALQQSLDWLQNHAHEYPIGHWLALNNGQLVADAPTKQALDTVLNALRQQNGSAKQVLIHKVIP